MTARQILLKLAYPFMMMLKPAGRSIVLKNDENVQPPLSVYELSVELINGETISLSQFRGKKLLIVNTASDCIFTGQYETLQKVFEAHKDSLAIIGFPSNDFKAQEKKADADIASFCKLNYGVTFPLAKKSGVTGNNKNKLFEWLTNKKLNGWNDHEPDWNFSKYLLDENGMLMGYYGPAVEPAKIIGASQQ
jgi:glutathione peroxidase